MVKTMDQAQQEEQKRNSFSFSVRYKKPEMFYTKTMKKGKGW